ncbi:MAG TPA: FkbM family methyltransferase [Acidimicrobiales bacterium]|nr:FkbM family methyltransferase [Acidimicrobiales bacterium]
MLAGLLALRFVPAAFQVTQPGRFLVAALTGSGEQNYLLRGSGRPVVVRHGYGSLEVMWEIFQERCYDPPVDVAERIPAAPRILDVGANVGAYSAFARVRWPEASIVAIEADPENVAALQRFSALDGTGRVTVVAAAATTADGPVRFAAGRGAGSKLSEDGEEVEGVDLLPMLDDADLLKLDIEQGEWPILADPRLAIGGPLVLVMEYHRRRSGDQGALAEARRLLTGAGFRVGPVRPNYWGHGTLWAWRS